MAGGVPFFLALQAGMLAVTTAAAAQDQETPPRESAKQYPHKNALVVGETGLTYAELHACAQRFAGALASLGLGAVSDVCRSILWDPDRCPARIHHFYKREKKQKKSKIIERVDEDCFFG